MKVPSKSVKSVASKTLSTVAPTAKQAKTEKAVSKALSGKGKAAVAKAVDAALKSAIPLPIRDKNNIAHTAPVKAGVKVSGTSKQVVLLVSGGKGALFRLCQDLGESRYKLVQHDESGLAFNGLTVDLANMDRNPREVRRQFGFYVAGKGASAKVEVLSVPRAIALCGKPRKVSLRDEECKLAYAGKPSLYNPAIEIRRDGSRWFTQAEFRYLGHNGSHRCQAIE